MVAAGLPHTPQNFDPASITFAHDEHKVALKAVLDWLCGIMNRILRARDVCQISRLCRQGGNCVSSRGEARMLASESHASTTTAWLFLAFAPHDIKPAYRSPGNRVP